MIETRAGRAGSPFPADAAVADRVADLSATVGAVVARDVEQILGGSPAEPDDAGTIPAAVAAELVARHGLGSSEELALLALPVARALAAPPISGYRVGAVGIEAETGDLILGGNLEFPGTELSTTIHAEGFVSLRARRRGRSLAVLAVSEAHPCAHCRQTLAESVGADALAIVDPLGHRLSLEELYPWAFQPGALGVSPDVPSRESWPDLALLPPPNSAPRDAAPPAAVAALLRACGARAHAPYSAAPSAVVVEAPDGTLVGAGCVESVAFNPSISATQAAFVELAARRIPPSDVREAWLARTAQGAVDPEPGFRALLAAIAPGAAGHVVDWRTGA